MDVNINKELQDALNDNRDQLNEVNRLIKQNLFQTRRGEKPHHDYFKLVKVRMDLTRQRLQLLDKQSKLPPPATVMHTPTREEWAIVRAAILRGEGPAWE